MNRKLHRYNEERRLTNGVRELKARMNALKLREFDAEEGAHDIVEHAQSYAERALETIATIAFNESNGAKVRHECCKTILDWAHGKAAKGADMDNWIESLTDEELEEQTVAILRKRKRNGKSQLPAGIEEILDDDPSS